MAIVLGIACGQSRASVANSASISLVCEETATTLAVAGTMQLTAAHCAAPWETLQFQLPKTIETIRHEEGVEIWLSTRGARVNAEIRVPNRHSIRLQNIQQITQRAPLPDREEQLTIQTAGKTLDVPFRELKRRFRAARGGDKPGAEHQISLCDLAHSYADPADSGDITVVGKDAAPLTFTAADCVAKQLVLRFSSKGEVRLRSEDGESRLLQAVTRIEL